MYARQDQFIHEISSESIFAILQQDPWKLSHQTITSADTNDNNFDKPNLQWMEMGQNTSGINAFYDIHFDKKVKRILDVGGGKYAFNSQFMQENRGIELLVWDPYNRATTHNDAVKKIVTDNKVEAATSMSVLNVIPELEVRLAHIIILKSALVVGGKAYFKIWSGEEPLNGSCLPSATHSSYQANAPACRFLREIEVVFGKGNVIVDRAIPNLIIAVKRSESPTSITDIHRIRQQSKIENAFLSKHRDISLRSINQKMMTLLLKNSLFCKKLTEKMIEDDRHTAISLQHEYDKRFGIIKSR